MSSKPTLLFDFDGTIADTLPALIEVYNQSIAKTFFCKMVEPDEVGFLKNQSYQFLAKQYGITWWKLPFLAMRIRTLLNQKMKTIPPVEGIIPVLENLKTKDFRLGILSSNSKENIFPFLQRNKIKSLFDFVYTEKNIFGKDKPLRRILKENSLPQKGLIYIGDEVRDIHAAKKVGIRNASVTWGFHGKELLEKEQPDFLFEKVNGLLSILE